MKSLAVGVHRHWLMLVASIVLSLMICSQAAAQNVEVYAFYGGTLKTVTQQMIKDTRVGTPFDFPITFFVIKHGSDWVAFDTGLNYAVKEDPVKHLGERSKLFGIDMKKEDAFKAQISKIGIKPTDIKAVIMSHGHWDHSGGLNDFKGTNIPIYFLETELKAIKKVTDTKKPGSYLVADYAWDALNVKPLNGIFDIFGDNTIVAFPTPGHTMGHLSLYVKPSKGKQLILTADALYTSENLQKMTPHSYAADFPLMMQEFTAFKIMDLIGAEIVPSHCPLYWAKGPWAPAAFVK